MNRFIILGLGYVGISNAVLFSSKYDVTAFDINREKVKLLEKNISPISDASIENFFLKNNLPFKISFDEAVLNKEYEYIIISLPTNFDEDKKTFDTSIIDNYIEKFSKENCSSIIVIKSTVPFGYVHYLTEKYVNLKILYSPEFLREGSAISDNLNPSRIVIGGNKILAKKFLSLYLKCLTKKNPEVILTSYKEAESIKLFSNTFLATRISFFNELDSFSLENNLDTKTIIKGVCSDERIGDFYNNPSFGYGGYCLPKDTKQLLSHFKNTHHDIIQSSIKSNEERKLFIASQVAKLKPKSVGIYKLSMKSNSTNYRSSAVIDIIENLKNIDNSINFTIYDKNLQENYFEGHKVIHDLESFKKTSEIIIANRLDDEINDVKSKVFSRDLFGNN